MIAFTLLWNSPLDKMLKKREGTTQMFPSLFTINFYTIFYFLGENP